jgi:hypothetical protein
MHMHMLSTALTDFARRLLLLLLLLLLVWWVFCLRRSGCSTNARAHHAGENSLRV